MDYSVFKLQRTVCEIMESSGLLKAKLPSKNVDEEFVMKKIVDFFNRISISVDEILNALPQDYSYPEIWQDIIKLVNLECVLSSILADLFVKDFSLNDIVNPENRKLNRCLRYLCNFLIYFDNKKEIIEECEREITEKRDKVEENKKEIKVTQNKNAETFRKKNAKTQENETLKEKITAIQQKLENNKQKKQDKQALMNKKRDVLSENEQSKMKHESEFREFQRYKAEVKKKLVDSPGKVNDNLERIMKQKEIKMTETSNLKTLLTEKTNVHDNKKKLSECLQQLLNQEQQCIDVKKEYTTILQITDSLNTKLDEITKCIATANKAKLDDSDSKHGEEKKKLDLKLKYTAMKNELLRQHQKIQSENEALKKKCHSLLKKKNDISNKRQQNEYQAEKLEEEIRDFLSGCENLLSNRINAILEPLTRMENSLKK